MEFKNFAKALGSDLFAEILCLFLAVTLSAVGGGLFRLISCICTIAVLVCVCVNYALSRSREDQHKKRKNTIAVQLFYSGSVLLPFLLLGISLLLARAGVLPGTWYRWYKLLNAPFLQLCNLCSDSFVPVVGKDSISGSVEPAAAGSGLGDLCIGEKWFPAGRTAISAEKIAPFMIGTDSFAEADALRAGRFPLPVPAERSATAPVIPEAAASGCGAAA